MPQSINQRGVGFPAPPQVRAPNHPESARGRGLGRDSASGRGLLAGRGGLPRGPGRRAGTRRPRRDGGAGRTAGRAARAGHGAGTAARLAAAAAWRGPGPGPGTRVPSGGPRGSRAACASRALLPGARTRGAAPARAHGRTGGARGEGAGGRGEAGTHRGRRGVPGKIPTSLPAEPPQEGPS